MSFVVFTFHFLLYCTFRIMKYHADVSLLLVLWLIVQHIIWAGAGSFHCGGHFAHFQLPPAEEGKSKTNAVLTV